MLTIDLQGAEALLDVLQHYREGLSVDESAVAAALDANAYFVEFYSRWEGCDRDVIAEALRHFDEPDRLPPGDLPERMAAGFRRAADEMALMRERMAWLGGIDTARITEHVSAYLPDNTPLDSVVHITVDDVNNAFMYRGEMGTSVLRMTDRETFEQAIAHELHHAGVRVWRERDPVHQALMKAQTGQAVAMAHVENLLSEGLANFYLTPGYVFAAPAAHETDESSPDPYQARLSRLQREEATIFAEAQAVLALSLAPDAKYGPCYEALKAIAMDMEDYMLPAGHYLGARMIQTMAEVYARDEVIGCVIDLPAFLARYNDAARQVGAFVFDDELVEAFGKLWSADARGEKNL